MSMTLKEAKALVKALGDLPPEFLDEETTVELSLSLGSQWIFKNCDLHISGTWDAFNGFQKLSEESQKLEDMREARGSDGVFLWKR